MDRKIVQDEPPLPRRSPTRGQSQRLAPEERGQTLVVFAVMLVALMGMLALVIDMGNIYAQRRQMQNAADAGALAGARALALNQGVDAAEAAVAELTGRNGASSHSSTISASRVTVTAHKTFPTYFAAVIGVPTFNVQATAEATYRAPSSLRQNLVPLAVSERTVWEGLEIVDDEHVTTDLTLGRIANGDRGWLNLDGGPGGESELSRWITQGYDGPPLNLGDEGRWFEGSSGTKNQAMHSIDTIWKAGTTTIILPVYDDSEPSHIPGPGNCSFHVIGFAAFEVSLVSDTGNPKYLEGHFVAWVPGDGDDDGPDDYGVRKVYLVR